MTRWLAGLLLAMAGIAGVNAQQDPLGAPQPDKSLRDPEFGVLARHIGLERDVLMLQWQSTPRGYARVWSALPIDSSTFAPGYENPVRLPIQSRRWLAGKVTVDGMPVDPAVIATLGQWEAFRPSFSALPGNLSATFQPEGNGLGTADDPMHPRVGDLRVQWRDLVLPPLDGVVVLRNGSWRLAPNLPAPASVSAPFPSLMRLLVDHRIALLASAFAIALVLLGIRRRRQS